MKALVAACATVALAVALPEQGITAARAMRISVSPASGGRSTTFTLQFTAPDRTGHFGASDRRDDLSVSGPAGRKGCVEETYRALVVLARGRACAREACPAPPGGSLVHRQVPRHNRGDRAAVLPSGDALPLLRGPDPDRRHFQVHGRAEGVVARSIRRVWTTSCQTETS